MHFVLIRIIVALLLLLSAGCSDDSGDSFPLPADAHGDDGAGGDASDAIDGTPPGDAQDATIPDGDGESHDASHDGGDGDDGNGVTGGAWADGVLTTEELFDGALIGEIVLEIDFEEGAEPYNGSGTLDWGYARASIDRLFRDTGATVVLPERLSDMQSFTVDRKRYGDGYSVEDILHLSREHRDSVGAGTTADFHILYLNGYYEADGGAQSNVLGVSIGRTRTVALFRKALDSVKTVTPSQRSFVEQTTLVHEIGHAVGLVNLPGGVPMIEDHEDHEHPGHDVDSECVMYWRNERASDVLEFVLSQLVGGGSRVLFCDACLADIDAIAVSSR